MIWINVSQVQAVQGDPIHAADAATTGIRDFMDSLLFKAGGWIVLTLLALFAAVLIASVVYAVMTVVTRAITANDVMLIPKGEKIAKLLRIK